MKKLFALVLVLGIVACGPIKTNRSKKKSNTDNSLLDQKIASSGQRPLITADCSDTKFYGSIAICGVRTCDAFYSDCNDGEQNFVIFGNQCSMFEQGYAQADQQRCL